jgi:hypothetical protein
MNSEIYFNQGLTVFWAYLYFFISGWNLHDYSTFCVIGLYEVENNDVDRSSKLFKFQRMHLSNVSIQFL